MIQKIKDIIKTYEPKKALIRIGIVLVLGAVLLIVYDCSFGFEACISAIACVAGFVYGIRIIREVPRFNGEREHYYRGYWSSYGWFADLFIGAIGIGISLTIAFLVGWFLMAVEVVQTIMYYAKKIKEKDRQEDLIL